MTTRSDVEDVEFRETTAAPVRPSRTPAARSKARHRDARRIGLQHLAFFRGYLEGLDLAELGDQYLEFGRDARKAAATRTWLVTAFVAAARKRQDFATARLLAIRPAALATSASPETAAAAAPSLEDFAAWHDPDGFHTEKELLELFSAHHAGQDADGATGAATLRRQQRNARLRVRQMAALDALARLVVEDPKPGHHVLGWFDTAVALRLSDVGITTIGRLVDTINAIGYRWYRDVPRLGETGARRITAWLQHYRDVDGLRIGTDALAHPSGRTLPVPQLRRERVTGIVPLEYFLIPPDLDGSCGANRNVIKNNSDANNDRQAIEFWLADYENPHTREKYRTEAERRLLWAIFAKGKPLSSLDINDARDYVNRFLVDPQPAAQWVMERAEPRGEPAWRPFRGPLSVKSRQDALAALKKFFGDLVNAQYLDHNAFVKIKIFRGTETDEVGNARRVAAKPRVLVERSLTKEAWAFAMRVLDALPDSGSASRIRFVLAFAYSTGLRRAEMCGAFTDDIGMRYAGAELGSIHLLRVVGKGAKERFVPLVPAVLAALGDYLEARGLPRDPLACPVGTPLIPALPDKRDIGRLRRESAEHDTDAEAALTALARQARPVHPTRLYNAVKRFFDAASAVALREDSPHARAFSAVSPHWLRHTFVSHALANGMSLESARNFAGHDSLDTTSVYATAELGRQYREAELFLRRAGV
ncbi:Tyrosine recombinase XerC [Paraburkholderia aspalathi]|uniref:Tyrosine recombinase XerC n=1 Tax=Paraburkholderia aspalathi TaxID=1324617 RepID=A0ABM8T7U7_9BURK|nr:phage integrase family protein [Paraburkholderia aspalathi]MBK3824103.1 tyrosine-type recombinase/integrase [Paraburkholderia aspalathi]MBK3835945.1 tyrosine-type recombinase/integrase [Paraburkholderia aspalathi]MBK3865721.1 tyrosine-type recombinase/integrase [Paraburkholderia aspalathi]CAE6865471.1 Tyrosine recombinase XerC [Paraburkholderia aspalathi]